MFLLNFLFAINDQCMASCNSMLLTTSDLSLFMCNNNPVLYSFNAVFSYKRYDYIVMKIILLAVLGFVKLNTDALQCFIIFELFFASLVQLVEQSCFDRGYYKLGSSQFHRPK